MNSNRAYCIKLLPVLLLVISSCATGNPAGDVSQPKCYLNRDSLKIVVLPVINESDQEDAGMLFDETATGIFEGWKTSYKNRYNQIRIITPKEVITYTATQGIGMQDIYRIPDQELGKRFDVDFIIHTKIYQVESSSHAIAGKEIWGQTVLIETASGALVWWCDWDIYQGDRYAVWRFLDNLIEGFFTGTLKFCIQYGCQGIFSRMPVIGKPLPKDKKKHGDVIDF
ncbi:MAG: hypothetical protein AAB038_02480 [Planctomycetota bacterium]